MREEDIMHEAGDYWVGRERNAYTVFKNVGTHSVSDSAYHKTEDGLSIAIARCDYLAKRAHYKPVSPTPEIAQDDYRRERN